MRTKPWLLQTNVLDKANQAAAKTKISKVASHQLPPINADLNSKLVIAWHQRPTLLGEPKPKLGEPDQPVESGTESNQGHINPNPTSQQALQAILHNYLWNKVSLGMFIKAYGWWSRNLINS